MGSYYAALNNEGTDTYVFSHSEGKKGIAKLNMYIYKNVWFTRKKFKFTYYSIFKNLFTENMFNFFYSFNYGNDS